MHSCQTVIEIFTIHASTCILACISNYHPAHYACCHQWALKTRGMSHMPAHTVWGREKNDLVYTK